MADLDRVRTWADALIRLHLDPRWTFGFDNARTRAGLCNYDKKRITVSRLLAARYEDDEIHQVLLHEVAHAIAGRGAGHGPRWKKISPRPRLRGQAPARRRDRRRARPVGRALPERARALPLQAADPRRVVREVLAALRSAVPDLLAEARDRRLVSAHASSGWAVVAYQCGDRDDRRVGVGAAGARADEAVAEAPRPDYRVSDGHAGRCRHRVRRAVVDPAIGRRGRHRADQRTRHGRHPAGDATGIEPIATVRCASHRRG